MRINNKVLKINVDTNKPYSIDFLGDTYQHHYEGKNLYNTNNINISTKGINIVGNKDYLIINGVPTDSDNKIDIGSATLPAGTYTIMSELLSDEGEVSGWIYIQGSWQRPTTKTLKVTANSKQAFATFTLEEEKNVCFGLYYISTSKYENTKMRLSIVKGNSADFDYESYVGGMPTPNPYYKEKVINVTGKQIIYLNGTNLIVDLKELELCKIGSYQDKIYKQNGKWYLHKEIGSAILNGSTDTWDRQGANNGYRFRCFTYQSVINSMSNSIGFSNYFKNNGDTWSNDNSIYGNGGVIQLRSNELFTDVSDLTTWLKTHNTIIYFILKTPTDTEITDTELIEELESIKLKNGENIISTDNFYLFIEYTPYIQGNTIVYFKNYKYLIYDPIIERTDKNE